MYGLVHQAIQEMVTEVFGADKWEQVRDHAGADEVFIGMEQYPDEATVGLVGAACAVLGASAPDVMRSFGQYWVGFTSRAYGELFEMSGSNFIEFVQNLNDLHTRVGDMMPDLKPPSFAITELTESSFVLHYHSIRPGLHPMILGLVEGLGVHFKTPVAITMVRGRDDGLDHDEFFVKYGPGA